MDPIKLKHIVERVASDEQMLRAERLQRGELSTDEAEALRTSSDPKERALYELFRPMDELEKRRILSAAQKRGPIRSWMVWTSAMSAAAVCALLFVGSLRHEPARVVVLSQSAKMVNGSRMLGVAPEDQAPKIDLGGCTVAVLRPVDQDRKLSADEKLLAFFQQGESIIPWKTTFRFKEATGVFEGTEHCMPIPSDGLSVGASQLVIVHGRSLPSESDAVQAIRSGREPRWASWQVVRTDVVLQQPPK